MVKVLRFVGSLVVASCLVVCARIGCWWSAEVRAAWKNGKEFPLVDGWIDRLDRAWEALFVE